MMELQYTFFKNRMTNVGHVGKNIWEDFEYLMEDAPMVDKKSDQYLIKLALFKNNKRGNKLVEKVTGVEGDYDAGTMSIEEAVTRLYAAGITCMVVPTASWTKEEPKWRVFAPFKEAITANTWQELARDRNRLLGRVNGVLGGVLSPESGVLAQCFYFGYLENGHREPTKMIEGKRFIDEADDLDDGSEIIQDITGEGVLVRKRLNDLRLSETLQVDDGRVMTLGDLLPEMFDKGAEGKWRVQSLWRVSESYAAFVRMDTVGRPCIHDMGTSITHHLSDEDDIEFNAALETYLREMRTDLAITIGEDADPHPRKLVLNQMVEQIIYIRNMNRYVFKDRVTCLYKELTMRRCLAGSVGFGRGGSYPLFDDFLHDSRMFQYDTVTFNPGAGFVTVDPLMDYSAVNTWVPHMRDELDDAENFAAPFLNHIRWLFGDRAEALLDWLAHIEQKPGVLPHTHWLHISPHQGTGRSWIGNVLSRVWRPYVAPSIELAGVLATGAFNPMLSGRLLAVVEEVNEGGNERWSHADRFKSMLTEEYRMINRKNEQEYLEYNRLRWLMFSNHDTALPLDETDRRIQVVKFLKKPKGEDYYQGLYQSLEDPIFIAAVGRVLLDRDISGFNPGRMAEMTADKKALVNSNQNREGAILTRLAEKWPYQLIGIKTIKGALGLGGEYEFGPRKLAGILKHYGKNFHRIGVLQIDGGKDTFYGVNGVDVPKGDLPRYAHLMGEYSVEEVISEVGISGGASLKMVNDERIGLEFIGEFLDAEDF